MTANAWSNEQSYAGVVQTNVDMYRGIIPGLARLSPNAVLLIASQPGQSAAHNSFAHEFAQELTHSALQHKHC